MPAERDAAPPQQLALFGGADVADPPPPEPASAAPLPGSRRFDDGQHRFSYQLRRARRSSIGIRIGDDGVVVSAPRWALVGQIEQALASKAGWVRRQLLQHQQRRQQLQQARIEWRDGGQLPYLGQALTLRLDPAAVAAALHDDATLRLPLPADADAARIRDATQAWMQRQALELFQRRCDDYAQRLGVTLGAVRLSAATTRWGSASADGVLRLHWRLLHFSPAIVDYVVAHEVAHLREMNHGPGFWQTVGSVFPDWRDARAALRTSVLPPW